MWWRFLIAFVIGAAGGTAASWLADEIASRYPWLAWLPFIVLLAVAGISSSLLLKRPRL